MHTQQDNSFGAVAAKGNSYSILLCAASMLFDTFGVVYFWTRYNDVVELIFIVAYCVPEAELKGRAKKMKINSVRKVIAVCRVLADRGELKYYKIFQKAATKSSE